MAYGHGAIKACLLFRTVACSALESSRALFKAGSRATSSVEAFAMRSSYRSPAWYSMTRVCSATFLDCCVGRHSTQPDRAAGAKLGNLGPHDKITHAVPDEYRVAAARCVIQKDCAYSYRRGDQRSSVAPLVKLTAVTARTHQPVATSYKALALLTRNKGTGSDMPSARTSVRSTKEQY